MARASTLGFDPRGKQLGLFSAGQIASPTSSAAMSFDGARRTALDDASWIEHVPGWLTRSQELFDGLLATAAWEQRDRWMYDKFVREPRLTAEYPRASHAPLPLLGECRAALSKHYGVPYDGLWLNLYRDHRDSTSWHADKLSCRRDVCVVPVLSLGASRQFLIRPRAGGRAVAFTPSSGDLLVMGGRCQRDWVHSVPKQARLAGARISVNFQSALQAVD
jgi:alkylated DNA repair dioxygenase AlkB